MDTVQISEHTGVIAFRIERRAWRNSAPAKLFVNLSLRILFKRELPEQLLNLFRIEFTSFLYGVIIVHVHLLAADFIFVLFPVFFLCRRKLFLMPAAVGPVHFPEAFDIFGAVFPALRTNLFPVLLPVVSDSGGMRGFIPILIINSLLRQKLITVFPVICTLNLSAMLLLFLLCCWRT